MKTKTALVGLIACSLAACDMVASNAESDLNNFYRDNHIYNMSFPCKAKTIDGRHFIKCVSALYEAKPVGDGGGYKIYTVNGKAYGHYQAHGRVPERLDELVDIPAILKHFD